LAAALFAVGAAGRTAAAAGGGVFTAAGAAAACVAVAVAARAAASPPFALRVGFFSAATELFSLLSNAPPSSMTLSMLPTHGAAASITPLPPSMSPLVESAGTVARP
jgi:hypothetical protein